MHLHLSAAARCTCAWRLLFGVNHLSRSRCTIPRCPTRESTHKSLHRVYKAVDRTWRRRTEQLLPNKGATRRNETHKPWLRAFTRWCNIELVMSIFTSAHRLNSLILTNVTQRAVKQWNTWNCKTLKLLYILLVSYSVAVLEY